MSAEAVSIEINGLQVLASEGVEIVSDLYSPEGSWSVPVAPGTVPVKGGELVRVRIADRVELVGTVGKQTESYDAKSHSVRLTGSTLAGLLKTSYITSFKAPPKTLVLADEIYTKSIPYLNRFEAVFHDEAKVANTHAHASDVGDTSFALLSEYARNRGLVFWIKPDGTRVYGKVVTDGEPSFRLDGRNIMHGQRTQDWDQLHSSVTLVSDGEEGHKKVTATNDLAPIERPLVAAFNGHSSDLQKQAKEYIRQEKMRAFSLEYVVTGFSQSGKPWAVNTLCSVDDAVIGLKGTYVVVRTVKRWNRTDGSTTTLTLGPRLEDPFQAFQKHGRRLRHGGGLR